MSSAATPLIKLHQGLSGASLKGPGRVALPLNIDGTLLPVSPLVNTFDLSSLGTLGIDFTYVKSIFVDNRVPDPNGLNALLTNDLFIAFNRFATNYVASNVIFSFSAQRVQQNTRALFPVISQRPIKFQVQFASNANFPVNGWPIRLWLLNWRIGRTILGL